MADDESKKTPVTIITGFLGAGKTTLVNHILKEKHGMKVAVVENEFGAVSIDDDLVSENLKAAESIVTMDNGCVCCTVRGDLIRALVQLSEGDNKFDAIIIETTGLADPAPVAFTFFINPEISELYKIDSILCLVDAKHIAEHLEEERPDNAVNEAVQQVAFADRILLNKTDLVTPAELDEVKSTLKSINSFADVITTQRSVVDLPRILGVNSFSLDATLDVDPEFLHEDPPEADHGHSHGADGVCPDGSHAHGEGVSHGHGEKPPERKFKTQKKIHDLSGVGSVGMTLEGYLDDVAFNTFMQKILQERARDIYRSKGMLAIYGQDKSKFVFQGVHEQINFGPSGVDWPEGVTPVNKLVFIGRNLVREELEAAFKTCLWIPLPAGWESAKDEFARRYYYHTETKETRWTRPE